MAAQAARGAAQARDPALAELDRAETLLAQGRYDAAAKGFAAFGDHRRHSLWGRAWFGMGRARHALGDTEGALAAWDDLWHRSLAETNVLCAAQARRAAGDAWLDDLGDPARALQAYDEAAARSAFADAAFDLNRGLALLMLGRAPEAAAVFAHRRDAAGDDKAEFLRWDHLIGECAAGRLAPPPRGLLPAERRARADMALADGLLAVGEPARALRLYRRAAAPLVGREGADHCDLQTALTLAALGRTKDALTLYARFGREHSRSPLAPAALLYAGTLCASPRAGNFKEAREWFSLAIQNHPGTREAEAAAFYTATLAWRGRQWTEAEKLHKAFATSHPDSPLARVALDERLPSIARKSLDVPLHDPVDRVIEVYVKPGDRKRKAVPIVKTAAYNAHLDIKPAGGYTLVDSEIIDQNSRGAGILWTGPDPKSAFLHRYHLTAAYSSQEYVVIDGTLAKPASGGGGPGSPPGFLVTVPSVDVDWEDFTAPGHEAGEDARHVIVPFTNAVPAIRWLWVQIPYDDYGIVHPILTLHCVDANALCLLNEAGASFPNGGQIDSRVVPSWPLRFRAAPLAPVAECIVRVLGEADSSSEQATDTIRARVVDVDLDIDANHDGAITDDDEPLEETAGGYVCVGTNSLAPVTLTLEPKTGLPGKLTLSATMGDGRIQVWTNIARTSQMTLPKVWNAGEAVPGTLYAEGITPSAAARDVELRLEYDESPQGQSNPIFKCADVVRLTILSVEFIDEVPDYSLDSNTDSDNFFLREYDGSGNSDSEDLDIYFRILPEDVPVSDVKIKIYRGDTSTLETTLDGEKDASGDFKTGDNLHTNWTPSVTLADDHPGFYRVQLEVYVDGQTEPICQTSIDDADTSTPGWQCPQDCLAIHDLTWKHRPLVHVHEDEIGSPSSIVEFTVESGDSTGPRVKEWTGGGTPTVHPAGTIPTSVNSFWDLFFDDEVTDGDLSGFSAAERAILATDAGEETVYHSANTEDANNFVFLQFWMFENFSQRPFGIPFDLDPPNVQHEGDMEHCQIAVRLSDSADASLKAKWVVPFGATASQHYYAQTLKWDINDGSAPANAHSQEHVEHTDNRLAIYVALGAHATYFAADGDIEVPDVGGVLGTQQQYDPNPEGAYDVSGPADEIEYDLMHVDDVLLGSFEGRWGYLINGDPDSFSNGPSGPPHRAAHASGGAEVILKTRPQDLHNMSRKTSQMTEMNIPQGGFAMNEIRTHLIASIILLMIAWSGHAQTARELASQAYDTPSHQEAIQLYDKAIEIDPQMKYAFTGRGLRRQELGDIDGAITDFTKALEIDPLFSDAYGWRAEARQLKGDMEGARKDNEAAEEARTKGDHVLREYEQRLSEALGEAKTYLSRAQYKKRKGDYAGAIEDFDKYLQIVGRPNNERVSRASAR